MYRKFLSLALTVTLGAFPLYVSAAETPNDPWPKHYLDISSGEDLSHTDLSSFEQETPIDTEVHYVSHRDHPFTDEELYTLFHELPRYLEGGSFALNRLNRLPNDHIVIEDDHVLINGKQFPGRIPWKYLEAKITDMLKGYEGDWSVYIKDLSSGKTMEINEHSMESASLIKLYIAGTIWELMENGTVTPDDRLYSALHDMIVFSDNESSNVLVRYMYDESKGETFRDGLAVVNDFIKRHGFTNTEQVNGIADPSLWVSDGRVNSTSAADCGRLLEMIYNRELISHFASFRFETLLNKQEVNYKIPAGLPEGTHISHKTGEVDDTENDAAIIYTPYGDYILCILSTNLYDTGTAVDRIHEITRLVHRYFTTPLPAFTENLAERNE